VSLGLIRRGDLVLVSKAAENDPEKVPETASEKYSAWLTKIFEEAWYVSITSSMVRLVCLKPTS